MNVGQSFQRGGRTDGHARSWTRSSGWTSPLPRSGPDEAQLVGTGLSAGTSAKPDSGRIPGRPRTGPCPVPNRSGTGIREGRVVVTEHITSPLSRPGQILYSVEEAAGLLGIGRTFMFHLLATGEIDSLKIGRRRKIPRDAIDGYIERLRTQQGAATTRSADLSLPGQ